MNPSTKLHLGSAGYCALLVGLNWSRTVEYSRQSGVTSEGVSPIALALLLSGGVALFLLVRCVRVALARLENGRRLKEGRWIPSRGVIAYALPLLLHRTTVSTWIEPDGALATASGGYGHAASSWVFLFAVLGLLLFQILARLTGDDAEPEAEAGIDTVAPHPSC